MYIYGQSIFEKISPFLKTFFKKAEREGEKKPLGREMHGMQRILQFLETDRKKCEEKSECLVYTTAAYSSLVLTVKTELYGCVVLHHSH